jgi:hypothetical protein
VETTTLCSQGNKGKEREPVTICVNDSLVGIELIIVSALETNMKMDTCTYHGICIRHQHLDGNLYLSLHLH